MKHKLFLSLCAAALLSLVPQGFANASSNTSANLGASPARTQQPIVLPPSGQSAASHTANAPVNLRRAQPRPASTPSAVSRAAPRSANSGAAKSRVTNQQAATPNRANAGVAVTARPATNTQRAAASARPLNLHSSHSAKAYNESLQKQRAAIKNQIASPFPKGFSGGFTLISPEERRALQMLEQKEASAAEDIARPSNAAVNTRLPASNTVARPHVPNPSQARAPQTRAPAQNANRNAAPSTPNAQKQTPIVTSPSPRGNSATPIINLRPQQ